MEQNSWLNSLMALVLFVACVLGCSKAGADAPKTDSPETRNSAPEVALPTTTDIAGDYNIVGTNEDGSPYKGALKVIKRGDVYQFRWDAGKQYDGIGIPNGNAVAVSFTGGSDGQGCGVVIYQALAGGMLDGKWGYWGLNEMGTEKGVRKSGSDLAGVYDMTGTNPNGNGYTAQLSITPRAGGYQFAWSNSASGFGIKQGNNVSVGIGGPRCAFVAYEIKPGGVLDGIWGGYGSDKTGTEKATRK
jgi:hypothetical protein